MGLARQEFHHRGHRGRRVRGRKETCPLVQFARRNNAAEPEIFLKTVTYYLVQERL
jgi:hypothetical protein